MQFSIHPNTNTGDATIIFKGSGSQKVVSLAGCNTRWGTEVKPPFRYKWIEVIPLEGTMLDLSSVCPVVSPTDTSGRFLLVNNFSNKGVYLFSIPAEIDPIFDGNLDLNMLQGVSAIRMS